VAGIDNNPDVCDKCDCPGIWTVNDARSSATWDVHATTSIKVVSGGTLSINTSYYRAPIGWVDGTGQMRIYSSGQVRYY
jgi:hypothetical protein